MSLLLLISIFAIFSLFSLSVYEVNPYFVVASSYVLLYLALRDFRQLNVVFLITALSIFIASLFADQSWDGKTYHTIAILEMLDGWDVYTQVSPELWSESYPKLSWFFGYSIVRITGKLDSATVINILVSIALFSYSYVFFKKSKFRLLISLLIVLNPVVIAQFNTKYVDGLLYCLFTIALLSSKEIIFSKNVEISPVIVFGLSLAFMPLLKFSGAGYSAIILFSSLWLRWRYCQCAFFNSLKNVLVFLSILLGFLIIGYNPYIKNLINGNNIFYPVLGWEGDSFLGIIDYCINVPQVISFLFSPFIYSNAGFEGVVYTCNVVEFVNPFNIKHWEPMASHDFGWSLSGFGPMFPLVLYGSLFCFVFCFKGLDKFEKYFFFVVISCCLITPHNWWVRYVPFLWLVWCVTLRNRFSFVVLPTAIIISLASMYQYATSGSYEYVTGYYSDLHVIYDEENNWSVFKRRNFRVLEERGVVVVDVDQINCNTQDLKPLFVGDIALKQCMK